MTFAETEDAVLGGRLRLRQMRRGHRVGHDAILLAAAVEASPGDHAVDLGAGVGAAGLAVAVRVPGVAVTLVEIDPELSGLASRNIAANGFSDRARALTLDVEAPAGDFANAGLGPGTADHVLMNPPFNDPQRQNVSPDPVRAAAHVASPATLAAWIVTAHRLLRPGGSLAMILRADRMAEAVAGLEESFGGVSIVPVHGRAGDPAIRVVLRGTKDGRAPLVLLPGLDLNDRDGKPTSQAEAILRHAQPLIAPGR